VNDPQLNLHAFEPRSRANGPGVRAVLWFQGCDLACPGCFNPATHDPARPAGPPTPEGRGFWSVGDLLARIQAEGDAIEGISVSGGEPLQQAAGLLRLLEALRRETALSVLLFSGYARAEIDAQPHGPAILSHVDVLVDGRYVAGERIADGLLGSANQRIRLLTSRYTHAEMDSVPAAEVRISPNGDVVLTGIDPPRIK